MAVPIQTTPTFIAGNPTKLFEGPWYAAQLGRTYDVSRDGKRFLMIKEATTTSLVERQTPLSITVITNWTEEGATEVIRISAPASDPPARRDAPG
ncbi:MAG TPA: hypothetical protein VKE51_11630 [Vicinamibacterales bacterium]|nr:hypothetical protein [Vicinamibacterales bacterium]